MIVITVARKPVEGTVSGNVLKHGTGALNIEATRIGTTKRVPGSLSTTENKVFGKGLGGHAQDGSESGHNPNVGRWPANVIFEHKPGCKLAGAVTVKGNRTDTRPEGDGGREDKSQWRTRPTDATKRGYSDPDGTETVDAWVCASGCPVAELDIQSGSVGNAAPVRGSEASVTGQNGIYGTWGRVPGVFYDDKGGASRFFFQCGGSR